MSVEILCSLQEMQLASYTSITSLAKNRFEWTLDNVRDHFGSNLGNFF